MGKKRIVIALGHEALDVMLPDQKSGQKVCLYNKSKEQPSDTLTAAFARVYMAEGEFEKGIILPEIQAAVDFIGDLAGKKALIIRLDQTKEAMAGTTGTVIHNQFLGRDQNEKNKKNCCMDARMGDVSYDWKQSVFCG